MAVPSRMNVFIITCSCLCLTFTGKCFSWNACLICARQLAFDSSILDQNKKGKKQQKVEQKKNWTESFMTLTSNLILCFCEVF